MCGFCQGRAMHTSPSSLCVMCVLPSHGQGTSSAATAQVTVHRSICRQQGCSGHRATPRRTREHRRNGPSSWHPLHSLHRCVWDVFIFLGLQPHFCYPLGQRSKGGYCWPVNFLLTSRCSSPPRARGVGSRGVQSEWIQAQAQPCSTSSGGGCRNRQLSGLEVLVCLLSWPFTAPKMVTVPAWSNPDSVVMGM